MQLSFEEGAFYKYSDLMGALEGGSQQYYLPSRGQQVFAAFLNMSKNPNAPDVILVGSKRRVAHAGALLARQQTPIPVFVKHSINRWRYCGRFRSVEIISPQETASLAKSAGRASVAFALRLEKFAGEKAEILPSYEEGKCGQVTRNKYERSSEARQLCLQHHGYRCCVCDLLFEEEYGSQGANFIHVHHLHPLHTVEGGVRTDPLKHLRPVCANCHAMIHAHGNLITPEELRDTYWSEASQAALRARIART